MAIGKWLAGLAALMLAMVGQTAAAQTSGSAMTIESSGTQAGCVSWERTVSNAGDTSQPQQVIVRWVLKNGCPQVMYVWFQYQKGCCDETLAMGVNYQLQPGQVYGGPGSAGPFVYYNPPTDRYLNFWMFQSAAPFTKRNRLDMTSCWPRYDRSRPAPPCPPAFRL